MIPACLTIKNCGKWSVIWVKILPLKVSLSVMFEKILSIRVEEFPDTLEGWMMYGRNCFEKSKLTKFAVVVLEL